MSVTLYFGEFLSTLINEKTISCKGLIRLAVKDAYPGKMPEELGYKQFKQVINITLRKRLESIGITNTAEIIKELNLFLVKNQSLLTMV